MSEPYTKILARTTQLRHLHVSLLTGNSVWVKRIFLCVEWAVFIKCFRHRSGLGWLTDRLLRSFFTINGEIVYWTWRLVVVTITIINNLVSGIFFFGGVGGGVKTLTISQKISEVSGVKSQCLYTHRDYTALPACAHVCVCVSLSLSLFLSLSVWWRCASVDLCKCPWLLWDGVP